MQSKTNRTAVAAWVALTSTGIFVVLLLLLHFVKSDLDPSWHFISEYAIGKHGWIMQAAFIVLAVANFALFMAIRNCMQGPSGWIGSFLFLTGTLGTVLAGIFIADPINTPIESATTSGNLHNLGGTLGLAGFLGTLVYSAKLLRTAPWNSARRSIFLATSVVILGFLVSFVATVTIVSQNGGVFGPDAPVGWPNRLGILSGCAWLMIVSWRATGIECQSH
jgi:Protein of unknown function (DUF998)